MRITNVKQQGELLVRAFESGIKDVLELENCEAYKDLIQYLKNKKYLRKSFVNKKGYKTYFFFKKKEDKDLFVETFLPVLKHGKMSSISTQYGLFLGFPPKCCEYFPKKTYGVETIENIIVNYNGMYFASYVETLEDDFKWLFENKPLKKGDFVLIGGVPYEVNSADWMQNIMNDLDLHERRITKRDRKQVYKQIEKKRKVAQSVRKRRSHSRFNNQS